jgi:Na+/H+ antiporter NhaD/arsenite permease-like protein
MQVLMAVSIIIVFIAGYVAIICSDQLRLDKAAAALLTGVLCWTIYIMQAGDKNNVSNELLQHLIQISSILFFLIGTMTIVSIIKDHEGFTYIGDAIRTKSKLKLLWIIAGLSFILSSVLANLTTAIVMTSISTQLLKEKKDRLWFTGIIVIAANAGGAFSPLGDVTTTMLWIGGQITAVNIILQLFLPGVTVFLVPLLIISPRFYNKTFQHEYEKISATTRKETRIILFSGIILLLMVPVFKVVTHLPPFMGVMFSLGILWIMVAILNFKKSPKGWQKFSVRHALHEIDFPGILFFFGILLAIAALQSIGLLSSFAHFLDQTLGNIYLINSFMGLASAVINNISLVAAAQGMYDLSRYATDHQFWELLALTTGTGGSILIIGSAAGIGAMGIEKINFLDYLKKIGWLAAIGFIAGIIVYIIEVWLFNA